jgi:photosystem II stability/assembly factor-like uncharacterized protein
MRVAKGGIELPKCGFSAAEQSESPVRIHSFREFRPGVVMTAFQSARASSRLNCRPIGGILKDSLMPGLFRTKTAALILLLACGASHAAPATDVTSALEWRLLGPYRAGWASVAAGVAGGSDTFYLGAAGGGVWKTDDAGLTWNPVFDGVDSASVGALAVSRSHPDTIYAGMGQVTSRYDIAAGDGVYRSDDAGRSWRHLGLETSRHIGAIAVDPRDPDVALVAALGPVYGPGGERGVFRTSDGGRTWQRTLFVSEDTGATDLAVDPADPRIVFAAAWQIRYRPWLNYFTPDTGPESGVYKSTDGGMSWKRVTGGGWPAGNLARIGLAASHRPEGTRVWALIDAESDGGLYRSDDGGANWQHVSSDPELSNSYFSLLAAAPDDPDTVYTSGRSIHRCTAGGTQCEIIKGSPGGDDHHHLWIDPLRPERMITAADQGASITTNGGRSWSSWFNQPTGQFYKLSADNAFPYRIYGGQQDSGTVRISSRSDYGSISYRDWEPVGADERDFQIADPRDPDIVYGSGLGGRLSLWNARNGEVQNIAPWPISSYGERATSFKQRYPWITPIAMSLVEPYPLYIGSQHLWRTVDQGAHWQMVSPDLSAGSKSPRNCDGKLDAARARDCGYGTIWSIGLSPRDNSEIWVGTDDGLVQLTKDGGETWVNVTPSGIPAWAKVSTVEPSATQPGTAYIAVDNHRQDDFRPRIFRTRDYGQSWTPAIGGLPPNHFVSVVRPDPVRTGVLYAGTETGVFVSFDDGDHWRSLQRNLPTAWVRDLIVHGDDLIAGTQGRAIWVLDGLAPLRQFDAMAANAGAHLFQPATAIRLRKNQNRDTPLPREEPAGRNPPAGALLDYWLAGTAKRVELEIRDASGALVRRFASDEAEPEPSAERYFSADWILPARALQNSAGMHRFVWDLRYPRPRATEFEYSISTAYGDGVAATPQGALAAPGLYRVVLRVDGREFSAPLTVEADPRVTIEPAALEQVQGVMREAQRLLARHYSVAAEFEYVGERIAELRTAQAGRRKVMAALDEYGKQTARLEGSSGDLIDNTRLKSIGEELRSIETDLEASDRAPTEGQRRALTEIAQRLDRAQAVWSESRAGGLDRLNGVLNMAGLDSIVIPPLDSIKLSGPSTSRELP